jgi:hypothetical protein
MAKLWLSQVLQQQNIFGGIMNTGANSNFEGKKFSLVVMAGFMLSPLAALTIVGVGNRLEDGIKKERAQQAEKWDGRTSLQCFYAAGKEQTIRVDGFSAFQILDMRKRIVGGDCKARDAFKPTAG